jgi:hypothetical protein
MKTVPDALGTAENKFGSAKYENGTRRPRYRRKCDRARKTSKWDSTPHVSSKMSSGAQDLKTGPDALGTPENESGRAKHENGTDALGTVENESGSAKHETGTRRPRNRRKRVRERKT